MMTENTVFDALLIGIMLLVTVIGYWQGITRGLMVVAGAFLGSELALWWSDEAGDRLADVAPLEPDTGRFVVSAAMVIGTALLVGVVLAGLVTATPRRRADRFFGSLVALFSAALIIGLVIRFFFIHMASQAGSAIGDTEVARTLWERFDWLVLGAALGCAALIAIMWVLGPVEPRSPARTTPDPLPSQWILSPRAPGFRPPSSSESVAPAQRAAWAADEAGSVAKTAPERESSNRVGASRSPRRAQSVSVQSEATVGRAVSASNNDGASQSADQSVSVGYTAPSRSFPKLDESERSTGTSICPNCGMLIKAGDLYCSDCGYPV